MTLRLTRSIACAVLILATAGVLRGLWLRADPPARDPVGIVWHDEGAWVHNARNRALWGAWRTDEWNPVFIAPVFTAFEYVSFRELGVGLWQARVVPVLSGMIALVALMIGVQSTAGARTALFAGAILATDYAFVMWNRAALMESTMTMFIVVGWAAYALAERRAAWGLVAGAAAALAWFTKSEAAFFVAALAVDAAWTIVRWQFGLHAGAGRASESRPRVPAAAMLTLAGLGATAVAVAACFVLPHWREYRFYNWQMTVTRKPDYSLASVVTRASWLPIVEGIFTRMWLVLAGGLSGALLVAAKWKSARPSERLLALWLAVGLAELIVYDAGNERRYVMFIPALVALTALVLTSNRLRPEFGLATARWRRIAAIPLVMFAGYLLVGSALRPLFRQSIDAGHLHAPVRLAAAASVVLALVVFGFWKRLSARIAPVAVPWSLAVSVLVLVISWNGFEYARWAAGRNDRNYEASVALGRLLPAGTLVQGKLANGLALDNRIRPLFVGNGFGNYADRLNRPDVRYILTLDSPRIGYESADGSGLIQGILDHAPGWHIVRTFDVDETPGVERAALIDKFSTTLR